MNQRRTKRWATAAVGAVFVTSLSLAACGGAGGDSGNKELVIATELPVSGVSAAQGLPSQYGADLAISQNKDLGNGYTLSVIHDNYVGSSGVDTNLAVSNTNALVSNTKVVAVVGPFNSGVAKVTMPITNRSGLVTISPANTNPGLTLKQYSADNGINYDLLHPAGKKNAYFRIPGTDVVQGKVLAQVASQDLSAKTAYVIDDNTTYGKGLSNFFTESFKANGGSTVGSRTSVTSDQVGNAPQIADTIKAANPDVVFFGGVTEGGGGAIKKQLVAKGFTKPMLGGDGITNDSGWLETAADGAVDTYGTVAAPDLSSLTGSGASKFQTDYKAFVAGKPNNDLIPYSATSYDAAMIEINAIKALIKDNKAVTRDNVRDEVAKTQYAGLTGQISFDDNGDNAGPKVFSVYKVGADKKWTFVKQVNG